MHRSTGTVVNEDGQDDFEAYVKSASSRSNVGGELQQARLGPAGEQGEQGGSIDVDVQPAAVGMRQEREAQTALVVAPTASWAAQEMGGQTTMNGRDDLGELDTLPIEGDRHSKERLKQRLQTLEIDHRRLGREIRHMPPKKSKRPTPALPETTPSLERRRTEDLGGPSARRAQLEHDAYKVLS